jgi:tetratricopeptide (TPR) repeat protein
MKDFSKAIKKYLKAVELSKENVLPLLRLAWVYVRNKQLDEGIDTLRKAIKIDPDNVDVLTKLGELLLRNDEDIEESEMFIKRALDINPDYQDAIIARGRIMEK